MPSILERATRAASGKPGQAFHPEAIVVLTIAMEDLTPPTLAERHPRYGGAIRAFKNTVVCAVRPQSARVQRNSYQQPDGFSVEVDARALPIAPKQMRNVAVEVYIWNAPYVGAPVPQDASGNILLEPVIAGLADDVQATWTDDGQTVTIDGQDYTALFSQRQWDPRRRAPAGLRLDLQLEQLMREGDRGGQLRLRVEPESLRTSLPIVGAVARRVNKKGQPVKENSSWWDVMYRMAQLHGFILFVEGLDVVLTRPQVLHQARAGLLPTERQVPVYRFAWGQNLASLEIQRHMGKETTPVIEVRSYDERERRTVVARYPSRGEKVSTGVGTEKDQVKRYTLDGVTDESTLRRTARAVYELIAKSEQTLSIATADLADLVGNDVLQMRSGEAAALDVDVYNAEDILRLPVATREQRLKAAGFPPDLARYVAANLEHVDQLKGPFRIKDVTIDYQNEGPSVSIEASLQEYVQIPTEEA